MSPDVLASEATSESPSVSDYGALSIEAIQTKIQEELQQGANVSIVKLVDLLVIFASLIRASDIHFSPTTDKIRVRFRIDGLLYDVLALPKMIQPLLAARLKILCGLRTDEHQLPQDGRFRLTIKDMGPIDVRVSIVPTYFGENGELRLLQTPSDTFSLDSLAFHERDMQKIQSAITQPYGMILSTGPTGSGKTTMLYAILKQLNKPEVSILTIEDPIEYSIEGIEQIQVNTQSGLTFATGLRAFLRQDPNVIMVGEIRDTETAEISVNAALTGHLVLSTIHTNNAATTLTRLIEFNVEPFLIASTVNIAIGQRLVRAICPYCRVQKIMTDAEYQSLASSIPPQILGNNRTFYVGQGCNYCGNSGYLGRLGIYEVLLVGDTIRDMVMKRATANEIATEAIREGMTTMLQDGFQKAISGHTTIQEVLRVVHE